METIKTYPRNSGSLEPGGAREDMGQKAYRPGKRCSIIFFNGGDAQKMRLCLRGLAETALSVDYEIIVVSGLCETVPTELRMILPSLKFITLPTGLKFERLCLEAAKQAQGEYVLFADSPVSKEQITAVVQQLESTQMYMITSPDKSCITVKRQPFLEAAGFMELLRRTEQLTSGQFDCERENEPQSLNTKPSEDAGFGQVLRIPDGISMLQLMPVNSVIAEIGVFTGEFSAKIMDITRPAQLHLIDAWPNEPIQSEGQRINGYEAYQLAAQRFRNEIESGRIVLHRKLSAYASQAFENEYFDWIYIDAGHYYEAVKCDLKFWYPKVKRGGFITGHDYVNKPGYGVIQAVNEFVRKCPVVFAALTQEKGGSLSWILKKLA